MSQKTLRGVLVLFAVISLSLVEITSTYAQRPSPQYCYAYARVIAARYPKSIMGGPIEGTAGGKSFEVIVGKGRKGAKQETLLGNILGRLRQVLRGREAYKRAYKDCMAGRERW